MYTSLVQTDCGPGGRRRVLALLAVVIVAASLVAPLLAGIGSATLGTAQANGSTAATGSQASPTPSDHSVRSPGPVPAGPPTPLAERPGESRGDGNGTAWLGSGRTYAACANKGIFRGALCNVIENAKRHVIQNIKQKLLGGAIDVTGNFVQGTLSLMLHRPVPKHDGQITVLRPPTNQPLAGAFRGWTTVGLPLAFLTWVIGVGIALASRMRPDAAFAANGFRIEHKLGQNFLLTLGSWWLGTFILHLSNGLIHAVAPSADQLMKSPEAGVGSLLSAAAFVWILKIAAAVIAAILFVTFILSYFLCFTLMGYLSLFSALMLFDTGVLQTIGWFGEKGWDIFIRAALFPLPAALILGGGTYIAGGTTVFVERTVAVVGFADIAGTLAFTTVMFVSLVTALLASLWMIMGARGASTAAGVVAGLGGAAMYSKAKRTAMNASMPNIGSFTGGGSATSSTGWSTGDAHRSRWGGALGSGESPDTAGALGPGRSASDAGGLTRIGIPTGGRPRSTDSTTGSASRNQSGTAAGTDVGAGSDESSGPVVVESEADLPSGQQYQPGYLSDGEFQSVITSQGREREMLVREHERFAETFDSEGDHGGIYLRGEKDGRLYDASSVAGEDWGLSLAEEAGMSRDAVYDARKKGRDAR